MDKENLIISQFSSHFIGDDGAVLENFDAKQKWVVCKDLFVEKTHFLRGWLSLKEIGAKAISVNISDAIAMNARAKFALLGLMIPREFNSAQIRQLCDGINSECAKFGVQIIGGDTIGSEILGISVTILAQISKNQKPLFRRKPNPGDLIAFSGKLGGAKKGFLMLRNGGKLGVNSRFRRLILRDKFVYSSSRFIRSMMDISDGLNCDLEKILCGRGVKFMRKLTPLQMSSGEEYEVLLTCAPHHKKRLQNEAKKARIPLTFFGKIINKKGKFNGKFSHF